MKIGVTAIGYECKEHLDKVLPVWKDRRINAEVTICAAHGIFPETAALGLPIYSQDGTIEALENYFHNHILDGFVLSHQPIKEHDLRNLTLSKLFNNDIDLLWLLDLQDEIYTVDQINNIIAYIQKETFPSWFKVRFKNYVINDTTYVDDFVAPRIWRTNRCMGIDKFYYDNEILFKSGHKQEEIPWNLIPNDVAFVKHLSWVGSPEYLKRKIAFQINHYKHCSYQWDEQNNCLAINDEFYAKNGLTKPHLWQD